MSALALFTAEEIAEMRPACARVARRAYVTDPDLARAFVDGVLESGADAEKAMDVIEHHCAELQIDNTLLVQALWQAFADRDPLAAL